MKFNILFPIFSLLCTYAFANSTYSDISNFLFNRSDIGINTEQFLLYHDGEVRFKKLVKGNEETRHLTWSMSKSISSLLFGIAEDRKYISRDDFISKFFSSEISQLPKKQQNFLNTLKVKHFLEMSSGIHWNEYYDKSPFNSHVVRMLYFATKKSTASYVLRQTQRHKPGTHFHYSSGDTNIITAALQKALPKGLKDIYPWEFLFNPMNIEAMFERDASGTFIGSSYLYLKTKDLLKLGILVLNNGQFEGKQIISREYLRYATSLNEAQGVHHNCSHSSGMTYGAQFWLNRPCKEMKVNFKDVPEDLVMMLGYGGQSVYIFPSEKIVAVRIANDQRGKGVKLNREVYAQKIIQAVKKWRNSEK